MGAGYVFLNLRPIRWVAFVQGYRFQGTLVAGNRRQRPQDADRSRAPFVERLRGNRNTGTLGYHHFYDFGIHVNDLPSL